MGHEEPRLLGTDKTRFQRQSSDQVHVLVVGTGEPIELSPGKLFVIGRDPRASLVVRYPEVSRQHAEIEWDDHDPPMPLLNEIRSRNGTFLNGARVAAGDPRPLRSGDEIRLGEAFRLLYLSLPPRELRVQLQQSGQEDTRAFTTTGRLERGATVPSLSESEDEGDLGDLVAAALGEADLNSLDSEGDFAKQHGKFLVKRLYTQRQTGVLTVYDGADVGEMLLVEGRCRHARLGMVTGREALEYVARLDRGRYRFRGEPLERMVDAPPPSEVDEHGLSLSGDFKRTPGSELVRDLISRRATGVLTVFDARVSGQVVLQEGICQEAVLGKQRDREALDAIVRLRRGVYRFRPVEVTGLPATRDSVPLGAPDTATLLATASMPREPRTGGYDDYVPPQALRRPPSSSALRAADDEAGVLRRSGQPMRGPREPETSPGRRVPPPPPPVPRRRPPPPPLR
ncbi:MAG: FHA domain-containing protein [Planctomycetota bacterium]